jgi:site-specific recombinase XerD
VQGADPLRAFEQYFFNRYIDEAGEAALPHGRTLGQHTRELIERMIRLATAGEADVSRAAQVLARAAEIASRPRPGATPLPLEFAFSSGHIDPPDSGEALAVPPRTAPGRSSIARPTPPEGYLSYDDFASTFAFDYGEAEMPERYEEWAQDRFADYLLQVQEWDEASGHPDKMISPSPAPDDLTIAEQVKAINLLQTHLAARPTATSPVAIWIEPALAENLAAVGASTMGLLHGFIGKHGTYWYKRVAGLSSPRALALKGWLEGPECNLGAIRSAVPAPTRTALARVEPQSSEAEEDSIIVARVVERLRVVVPAHLDGSTGQFRAPKGANALGVDTDLEAISVFLTERVKSPRTFEAYAREIQRFYLWCMKLLRKEASSITVPDVLAYRHFLQNIPSDWVYEFTRSVDDSAWRPFKSSALTNDGVNYAVTVLRTLYKKWQDSGYLVVNPFKALTPLPSPYRPFGFDASRSLDATILTAINDALLGLTNGLEGQDSLQAAFARRTRLIVELGLITGLRLAEMTSTKARFSRPEVDGRASTLEWHLEILGKGKRQRSVFVSNELRDLVDQHHADFRRIAGTGKSDELLAGFNNDPPLITTLAAPVGSDTTKLKDGQNFASDNGALTRSGVLRILKRFFASVGETLPEEKRAVLARASTHWLRHTFAKVFLQQNPGSQGLSLLQTLLGHASIATTGHYAKQDASDLAKAVRSVNPLRGARTIVDGAAGVDSHA